MKYNNYLFYIHIPTYRYIHISARIHWFISARFKECRSFFQRKTA